MDNNNIAMVDYWRTSLMYGNCASGIIKRKDRQKPWAISERDFREGKMPKEIAEKIFGKKTKNISIAIRQEYGKKDPSTGKYVYITPIVVICDLTEEGVLNPQKGKSPYVPRDLLRPMHPDNQHTICELCDYDAFRDENDCDYSTWEKFLEYYDLLKQFLEEGLEDYRKLNDRVLVEKAESGVNYSILKLCREIIYSKEAVSQLFKRATELKKESVLKGVDSLAHFDERLGHVGCFPLADAQRDSASHMLEIKEGSVLAVNGPPGTGKTTMLLSIVATEWVRAAMEGGGAPPVIVAASANNQAVTNIIDSFENLDTGKDALAGRWLPEIKSYGSYFPSRNKKDALENVSDKNQEDFPEADAEARVPEADAIDGKYHTDRFFNYVETADYVNSASGMFLEKAKTCYPDLFQAPQNADNIHHDDASRIKGVKSRLSNKMSEGKTKLKEIKDLWESFCSAHDGIKNCFGSRNPHNELNSLSSLYEKENQCLQACYRARKELEKFKAKILVCIAGSFSWLAPAKNWLDARARLAMEEVWPDFLGDAYQLDYNRIKKTIHEVVIEKARIVRDLAAEKKHKLEVLENYLVRQKNWIDIITELGEKDRVKAFIETLNAEDEKAGKEIKFCDVGWLQENSSEVIFENLPDLKLCDKLCDLGVRFELFRLATHYWEASWLIEMAEMVKKPNELKDEGEELTKKRWLRRMMLTPCSVFTLYMLPKNLRFKCGDYYYKPLFNFADLLIVDEAGQVPVEIGAPSFALAKRALVVGDTEQIEPIWAMTENIDKGNIKHIFKCDGKEFRKGFRMLRMRGKLASGGSLMKLAQNLTPYHHNEKLSRGMFLNEHRRCFDEIIKYSNELCYKGELTPKRGAKAQAENSSVAPILPALGYVHVDGVCVAQGGSRKNELEAQYIAAWIKENNEALCNKYSSKEKKKGIHEIVGIITPFAAQKEQIIAACKNMGFPCKTQDNPIGVAIGTVHALQGAERNVVIFSSTYSAHSSNSYFFDKGNNMLNVAVSRAKDSFIVFGDMDIFDQKAKTPSGILASFLFKDPTNKIEFLPGKDFFSEMKLDRRQMLLDNEHDEFLKAAIKNAKSELIIVSPWITEQGLVESGAQSLLLKKKAESKNTDITIYADGCLTNQDEVGGRISELRNAGIQIVFKDKIHCKTLIIDRTQIWTGSYNWLSAARNPDSKYARTEISLRIDDEDAGKNIIDVLKAKQSKGYDSSRKISRNTLIDLV